MRRKNNYNKETQGLVAGAIIISGIVAALAAGIRELLIYIEFINP